MAKEQLRFTGSGGQGVILGTIIMAEAAYLDGKNVVQSQSYGPEARGGMCKAETIIDDDKITYTKVTLPTLLLSLTQVSFNKYVKNIDKETVIVVDDSINVPARIRDRNEVLSLPIISSAKEVIKNPMAANIISVGAVNEALKLASVKSLEEAVLNHIPKGTEELNTKAMKLGAKLVKIARGEIKENNVAPIELKKEA
ncbi:MAG: 2-oxoacid:acceptor oxidoreductase family protein [Eubacteriaceae bacterium]|nr:2-oxoacid:acceptor oxidoreductase family protein [Eubacteriaceae bacterium]